MNQPKPDFLTAIEAHFAQPSRRWLSTPEAAALVLAELSEGDIYPSGLLNALPDQYPQSPVWTERYHSLGSVEPPGD